MMMYRPTTNITASSAITPLTIQCAWLKSRAMSRLAPSPTGILPSITPAVTRTRTVGQIGARMAFATLLWLVVHGCDTVDGGAVELSWKLRPASSSLPDKFVECESGKDGTGVITKIRLEWAGQT